MKGITLLFIVGFLCSAQNRDTRHEFEVSSIRQVKVEGRQFPPTALRRYPQRIDYSFVTLPDLVRRAYDLPNYRMIWPDKLEDAKYGLYSISATFPQGTTEAELREMLQRLLEDRLALRTHWVKKALPVYEVKIAVGGAKIPRSKYDPAENPDPKDNGAQREEQNRYSIFQGREGWHITGVISMRQLTAMLGTEVGRPMIDKTGMDGYHDIDFTWNRPYVPPVLPGQSAPGEASTPEGSKTETLFPALEKQLGLRAESARLDVDVLTIDSVERVPTDN